MVHSCSIRGSFIPGRFQCIPVSYILRLFYCFCVTPQSKFKSQRCRWQEHLNSEGNEVSVFYKPFPVDYWKWYSCIPPSHREAKLLVAVMWWFGLSRAQSDAVLEQGSRGSPQCLEPNQCPAASLDPSLLPAPAALPAAPQLPPCPASALTHGCLADLGQEQTFLQR